MSIFGDSAVLAVKLISEKKVKSPEKAWTEAINTLTPSEATRLKGCPRNAFLGLCESGLVYGIPKGTYTGSEHNKQYAISAIEKLRNNPSLSLNKNKLWEKVVQGNKAHNGQMDVVLSLWNKNLINK